MSLGIRTPGPIHLFALFRQNPFQSVALSSPFYVGTCVAAPEPEHEKFKIPIMNDVGGRSVPFQLVQDGETAYVSATMNRFDYNVIQTIRGLEAGIMAGAPTNPLAGNPGVGGEAQGARGTLHIGISDWSLVLFNEYSNTTSAGDFLTGVSDLIHARGYLSVNVRKYKESTVGTRVLEVALLVECQNLYSPASRSFRLLTENASLIGDLRPLIPG